MEKQSLCMVLCRCLVLFAIWKLLLIYCVFKNSKPKAKLRWTDDDVCPYSIAGFCPHDLFPWSWTMWIQISWWIPSRCVSGLSCYLLNVIGLLYIIYKRFHGQTFIFRYISLLHEIWCNVESVNMNIPKFSILYTCFTF